MTEGSRKGHTPLPPTCLRSDKLDYYGCDHEERRRRRWWLVIVNIPLVWKMIEAGERAPRTRSDKRGRDTGHPGERRGTKKRTRRMARRMGETFTLRPKMKIVLLDALRRGQRTRHIISALASVASATKTAVSSFFLDSHQCASSIIARLTAQPIPASGSLFRGFRSTRIVR